MKPSWLNAHHQRAAWVTLNQITIHLVNHKIFHELQKKAHLTRIDTAFRIASAQKIVCDWLIVGAITIFVSPNWKFGFALYCRFFASIICSSPSNYASSTTFQMSANIIIWGTVLYILLCTLTCQSIFGRKKSWFWQTNWNNEFWFTNWSIQNHNGDVIVKANAWEPWVRSNLCHFKCNWCRWFTISGQVDISQSNGKLTCGKSAKI